MAIEILTILKHESTYKLVWARIQKAPWKLHELHGTYLKIFIFLFVLKGQLADTGNAGGAASFATGAWIYLVGNVLALIGGAAVFFKFDVEEKVNEFTKGKKDSK